MLSTRAFRHAHNARLSSIQELSKTATSPGNHGFPATASYVRFNSSVAETQDQNSAAEGNDLPIRRVYQGGKFKIIEQSIGEEKTTELRNLAKELRRLRNELRALYSVQRSLRGVCKGPYKIAVRNDKNEIRDTDGEAELEDNMIKVGSQTIPNIWLRDNCQCKNCVHEATKQRLLDTFAIPEDISVKSSSENKDSIDIEWSDGHKSQYAKSFLKHATRSFDTRATVRQGLADIELWGAKIAEKPPRISDPRDKNFTGILNRIRRYGFCYIDRVPATPEATESLLRRISFIRETHYGGFYDFTADLASKDTAYTNIALDAHTDTTYFSDPAGLQAFHLLEHSGGEGGASLLVDGFHAASQLLEQDPEAYRILATVNVHGHASGNEGISIQPYRGFPVLQHDLATGTLLQVRWNSSDRSGIELPVSEVGKWYDAARKFDALLKKKENEYWEQLKPGTVLIFDNWRVLHGRSAFTGKRRICGGYINRDDWISKFKMLHFGKEEVMGRLASG